MRPAENKPDSETLRRLYEDQRLTTRQIGKEYGVAHITIRRWLTGYGITVRPKSQGLTHRGITAPTTEELHDLVHVHHLSYVAIADRYNVHFTAVPQWLDRHGIRRPDPWITRRKGHVPKVPTVSELRHRRAAGESATSIAASCGVDKSTIVTLCKANGIEIDRDGWNYGKRYSCRDGHEARSVYEQRVDDWLTEHGLAHETEPHYPFGIRYQADFLVDDKYIEVWGVVNNPAYQERKRKKIRLCQANSLPLIQINHWQFAKGRKWWRPLEILLRDDAAAKLF